MSTEKLDAIHASLSINRRFEKVGRDEYVNYMTFQVNERPLFTEHFGPLIGLKEEWIHQGATPDELDFSCFRYRTAQVGYVPVNTGWLAKNDERILEETESYILALDRMGRRVKLCKGYATLPLPLDYPVKKMEDWLRIKQNYDFSSERLASDWRQVVKNYIAEDKVITIGIPGGFDELRQLMGEENACLAYYEQPELVRDILKTISNMVFEVSNKVSHEVQIDQLSIHEDMAGKSGPLAGPKQICEFIKPYYLRVWDMLRSRGCRLFMMDSDGNMNPVLDDFVDCGINVMGPMEPAAGMNIVESQNKYQRRLAYWGGLDKLVLLKTKKDIRAELEYKLPPIIKSGGCILGLDHRVPNGATIENYRFYVKTAWEIIDSLC